MNRTLDIDLLRTFHAVARLGQFRAAAQEVHRSPAAVSVHIQRLEDVAGGRLLERDNQSVALTPLGQRLLAGTAPLLRGHDRVLEELRGAGLTGLVRLGVPDEYAAHVIRDILPGFAAAAPEVVLEVQTAPSLTLRAQLGQGRLHLALVTQPRGTGPDPAALTVTQPVWVAGSGFPAELPRPIPLAMHAADCPYQVAMQSALDEAGRSWRTVLTSPSSRAVEACVEAGLAVSLIDRARLTPRMRVLPDLPPVPAHEVVLLAAPAARDDPAACLLRQSLHRLFHL